MDLSMIGEILDQDPYLAYQPAFVHSLPIQLFVNAITITLLCVLFIHLLFTTQYHYPLAPLNYCLQFLSIILVLTSVLIKCVIILNACGDQGDVWPYDLIYVAVTIPPTTWSMGRDAAWFLLQALNMGLANITHVQFLTLLYPSRTEARLILCVLGPLAITSSGLVFVAMSASQKILDVGDSIRNVLNSTLLLIFAIALTIWGLLVNRRRAWRTDGGTAVFGFGALLLAVITTTFNFVAVAEDGIEWLQHLLYAAVLWQTWLGWWWWVGSGMGIGEVEDMMERAEKKKRKLAKHATRQRADAAKKGTGRKRASSLPGFADGGIASANTMADLRSGVASIIRTRSSTLGRQHSLGPTQSTKSQHIEEGVLSTPEGDIIEMDTIRPATATPLQESADISSRSPDNSRNIVSTSSETSSTSATPSIHVPRSVSQLLSFPTTWLQVYLRRVRRAHHDATRKLALERAERRQQMVAGEPNGDLSAWPEDGQAEGERTEQLRKARRRAQAEAAIVGGDGIGWGLGSFGIKEHHESASRLQNARDRLQEDRLLSSTVDAEDEAGPSTLPNEGEPARIAEEDWEDVDDTTSSGGGPEWDDGEGGASRKKPPDRKDGSGAGWSWWGPLRDWRLADRSVF